MVSIVGVITRASLEVAARAWSVLPGEGWRTTLLKASGPSFLVSVWAVILDHSGRVLLFEHTHDRHHPWGLPSGRLMARETLEEALEREFREEVGGELTAGAIVVAFRDFPLPALRLAYRCEVLTPPIRTSFEVSRWRYFPLAELPMSLRPLQRLAIERACSTLMNSTPPR